MDALAELFDLMEHSHFICATLDDGGVVRLYARLFYLPIYETLSYLCMRPYTTRVCGLKLLVYESLSYLCALDVRRVVRLSAGLLST